MTTLYKLTDADGYTHNRSTLWSPGVTHTAVDAPRELCTRGVIHAYEDPLVAVFVNPIHAYYDPARLWEAKGRVVVRDDQLKCGCVSLTTIKEIKVPVVTKTQRVAFGILCAKEVCENPTCSKWADRWLSGQDRSVETAYTTRAAFFANTLYRDVAANDQAAYFASVAFFAVRAADAAYFAASAAYIANHNINIISIAKKAMEVSWLLEKAAWVA